MGSRTRRRRFVGGVLAATAAASLTGCGPRVETPVGDLARYELAGTPDWRVTLPAELREISGLAVTSGGRLFAHGDEEGRLFEVAPRTGNVLKSFALEPGTGHADLGKKSKDGLVAGDFMEFRAFNDDDRPRCT